MPEVTFACEDVWSETKICSLLTSDSGIVDGKRVESSMFVVEVFVFESPESRREIVGQLDQWEDETRTFSHRGLPANPHPQRIEGRGKAACSSSNGVRAILAVRCRIHHPELPSYEWLGIHGTEGFETKVELERSKCLAGRPIAIVSALRWRTPQDDIMLEMPPPSRMLCGSWQRLPYYV